MYETVDTAGNVGRAKAVYQIVEGITITGAEDKVIEADQIVDEAFALEGVKAYETGVDISDRLTVTITPLEGAYKVEYSVADEESGMTITEAVLYTVEEVTESEEVEDTENLEETVDSEEAGDLEETVDSKETENLEEADVLEEESDSEKTAVEEEGNTTVEETGEVG